MKYIKSQKYNLLPTNNDKKSIGYDLLEWSRGENSFIHKVANCLIKGSFPGKNNIVRALNELNSFIVEDKIGGRRLDDNKKLQEKLMKELNKDEKISSFVIKNKKNVKLSQMADPLNGKNINFVKNYLRKNVVPVVNGLYNDDYWNGVKLIWDSFSKANLNWNITESSYEKNEEGTPVSKRWKFEIKFIDNKGKDTILSGVVVASGAGTKDEPLSKYDVVWYFTK